MTHNEIRYYMHNMQELQKDIIRLIADIQKHNATLPEDEYKPSGENGVRIQLTSKSSYVEIVAMRRAEYCLVLKKKLRRMQDIQESIHWVLRHLSEPERIVFRMKYIEKRRMQNVAVRVGFSKRKAEYIDTEIVKDIERHFQNMQKKSRG